MHRARALLIACAVLAACGDDAAEDGDAGPPTVDGSPDGSTGPSIAAPMPPAWDCPSGWRAVEGKCDPWPESGYARCPIGEAHFPGTEGCAPIGAPCPSAGEFPDDLPATGVRYVREGSGGDGSRASPYGTIVEALTGASTGTIVAVAAGTYEGQLEVPAGVTIRGACAAHTTLTSTATNVMLGPVVSVRTEGAVISDLRIADAALAAIMVRNGGSAEIRGVLVEDNEFLGVIVVEGAHAVAEELVLRRLRPVFDGNFGRGVSVQLSSSMEVRRAVFEDLQEYGAVAIETSTLRLEDVAIVGTRPNTAARHTGTAVYVQSGSTVELARVALEDSRSVALFALDEGTTVTGADVVIRSTGAQEHDGKFGRAIDGLRGPQVTLTRAWLHENHDVAAIASMGATLVLQDAFITATQPIVADGTRGSAVAAQMAASVELRRVVAEDNHDLAVFVIDPGTTLVAEDLVVRRTQPQESDELFGRGIEIIHGGTATVTRALFEANHDLGVLVHGDGASAVLAEVAVRATESRAIDGIAGRGIGAQLGAVVTGERIALEDNREFSLLAFGIGTSVDLRSVRIHGTRPRACAETTCAGDPAGSGVGAFADASVTLHDFVVDGSYLCGVQLARDATLDLDQGEVTNNDIGACVQVDGYDLDRVSSTVRYSDNETQLQSTTLPVPDPATAHEP